MTKLSLIMLTNTVNNDIYRMTQNALDSLHNSIGSENFNVVLEKERISFNTRTLDSPQGLFI